MRAFDTHGVITTADPADLGILAVALRQLAVRGALTRVGYGVYRMAEVPPTPMSEYAQAVALVGAECVIVDEAVLAMHELALVSPARIKVARPRRTRAALPPTVQVVRRTLSPEEVTHVEGIPAMTIAAAVRGAGGGSCRAGCVTACETTYKVPGAPLPIGLLQAGDESGQPPRPEASAPAV